MHLLNKGGGIRAYAAKFPSCSLLLVSSSADAADIDISDIRLHQICNQAFRYDFHYDSLHKHLYNVFFLGSQPTGFSPKKPFNVIEKPCSGVDFPGATHCEEIPYMFDVSKYHSYNIKIWQCQVDINSYNIL